MPRPIKGSATIDMLKQGIHLEDGNILKLVDPLTLKVDFSYQRPPVPSTVDRIRREFNPDALGIFQLAQRRGTDDLYIVDAQNRHAAIKLLSEEGHPDVPKLVLALIRPNTSVADEATYFVLLNTNRPVTGNAKFKARLQQHKAEPEQAIKGWLESEGFTLDFLNPGRPGIGCGSSNGVRSVGDLLKAYNQCPNHLQAAMKLLRMVWGDGKASMVPYEIRTGQVLYGLAMFVRKKMDLRTAGFDKELNVLIKRLKDRHHDLVGIWTEIKKTEGYGYDRPKTLADRMKDW